jgi:hypothetical protein
MGNFYLSEYLSFILKIRLIKGKNTQTRSSMDAERAEFLIYKLLQILFKKIKKAASH